MGENLSRRFNRAKDIYQEEGLFNLIIRVIRFLFYEARVFYRYKVYYLYEHTMGNSKEADFLPRIQNYIFKIVTSNKQADELSVDGLTIPEDITKARHRLNKGAIAFCVFVEGELAHIAWVAMTKEAKELFDSLPYKIDFSNQHAWVGGVWTNPKYRRKGLQDYVGYKRIEFLRETGVLKVRCAVEMSNIASNKSTAKQGYRIYAKGRSLRILWWKSWKETPVKFNENN